MAALNERSFVLTDASEGLPESYQQFQDGLLAAPSASSGGAKTPTLYLVSGADNACDCMQRIADGLSKDRRDRVTSQFAAQAVAAGSRESQCGMLAAIPGVTAELPAEAMLDVYGSVAGLAGVSEEQLLQLLPIDRGDAAAVARFFAPQA